MHSNRTILIGWGNFNIYTYRYFVKITILHKTKLRFSLQGRSGLLLNISILLASIFLLQACGGNKGNMQAYVDNYIGIIKDLKSQNRVGIIKTGAEAIIAYRKSGFTDVDNAERAKNSLLEGIRLDSISLQHAMSLKSPDPIAEKITQNLLQGINSAIQGNILFASNYSRAKDQNIEQRKVTILNVRPGMKYLAVGLNSIVNSIEGMQAYIKDYNLNGAEDLTHWYTAYKIENDNIKGFLKN